MSLNSGITDEMPGAVGAGLALVFKLRPAGLEQGQELESVGASTTYTRDPADVEHPHELESPGQIRLQLFPADLEQVQELEGMDPVVRYDGDVGDIEHGHELEEAGTTLVTYQGDVASLEQLQEIGDVTGLVIPSTPQNFNAERINSGNDTELTWDEVPEASEYIISFGEHHRKRYRELTTITNSSTTSFTHNHGNPNTRYEYRIYAVHRNGGKSARSVGVYTAGNTTLEKG